jgi:biopolymer transport protein ExbD
MTGGFQRRAVGDGVSPLMNVTPLVDVVLVLLIIFMVVAPQLGQDTEIDLPGIFNSDPDSQSGEPFKVTTQGGGHYNFQGQLYDLDGIIATLEAEHTLDPLRRLVLRADAQVRYADVREFQRRLEEVGFPGMAYMVNERHREEDPSFADLGQDGNPDPVVTASPDSLATDGAPLALTPPPSAAEGTGAAMSSPTPLAEDGAQPWQ